MTTAKFKCVSAIANPNGGSSVKLTPVVGGSPENDSFFKNTPAGTIDLAILNPQVQFEEGKEYFVDFATTEEHAAEAQFAKASQRTNNIHQLIVASVYSLGDIVRSLINGGQVTKEQAHSLKGDLACMNAHLDAAIDNATETAEGQ